MGHFSKFVPPGSVNLETSASGREDLPAVAFQRPDGVVAVVAVNRHGAPRRYTITAQDGRRINLAMPPHALQTVLFRMLPGRACAEGQGFAA